MTTYEYATLRTRGILASFALWIAPRRRRLAYALGRAWAKVRPVALPILGAGCFVAAAFTVSTLTGLIAAGFGFFFIEWRSAK